jgi:hypothetical protein
MSSSEYMITFVDLIMIIAPNIGFIAQILKFRKEKSAQGFSKLISFLLLTANIIRIFFWVGARFTNTLLYQSILMILTQILLIYECLKYSNKDIKHYLKMLKDSKKMSEFSITKSQFNTTNFHLNALNSLKSLNIIDFKYFWNWPFLDNYIYFILIFTLCLAFTSNSIGFDNIMYSNFLGCLSLSLEAMIGIPQIISNHFSKNTASLSKFMIFSWVLGDSGKSIYNIVNDVNIQFIACGLFQLFIDFVILFQIIYYGNGIKHNKIDKQASNEFEANLGGNNIMNLKNKDAEEKGK